MRRPVCCLLLIFFLASCRASPFPTATPAPSLRATETRRTIPTRTPIATSTVLPTNTAIASLTATAFPPGPWKLVAVHNLTQNVMAAGFLTEDYGITVGTAPGVPFVTTDGGKTWTAGTMQADCRYGLDIIDKRVAWASGGAMDVRRTTDGGATWPAVTDYGRGTTRPFHTISFLDGLTGWQATLYMFGSTQDGGTTWTDVPLPTGVGDMASVNLIAPETGYLLDFSGRLYFTRDNGVRWKKIAQLDLAGLAIPQAAYTMMAMRFFDELHGLIVASEEYQIGKVKAFHTADGGNTWTSELVPVGSGPVFLSRQGPLLTVITGADILTVVRYDP